jgi:phospholipid/cholesterol/gamma-HCH transport system permease protein
MSAPDKASVPARAGATPPRAPGRESPRTPLWAPLWASLWASLRAPLRSLDQLGEQLAFYGRSLRWTGRTLRRYRREVLRLLAEVSFGTGALAVVGGTVGVICFLTFFTGTEVGLQGYQALNQLGSGAFAGFVSAYFNTREISPLVAAIALSATVGCGFTARLGAMRISEEVDALEVMAVPSLPFLVTTRMIAGFLAVIPLYVTGLLSSYLATRTITTVYFGQSPGTYDYYFHLFLPPSDVVWSFGKALVFSVIVIAIHCYYGYTASGGPAGVGMAVGRAVRAAIVSVNVVDFFLSLAIWGATTTVRIAG